MFMLKNDQFLFVFFVTAIISVEIVVVSSQSIDRRFEACLPQHCGNGRNISYPFWIDPIQQDYCGYPEFRVTCRNGEPILHSSGNDYIIQHISYEDQYFRVENSVGKDSEFDSCPSPLQNTTFGEHDLQSSTTNISPFNLGPNVVNLSFFYNCTTNITNFPDGPDPNYVFYPKNCTYTDSLRFSFVMASVPASLLDYWNSRCKTLVLVPVEVRGSVLGTGEPIIIDRRNYTLLLENGFLLEWNKTDCNECQESGGNCGFDKEVHMCFCVDRPYPNRCNVDRPEGKLSSNVDGPKDSKRTTKIAIGVGAGVGGFILACLASLFFYLRHRKNRHSKSERKKKPSKSLPSDADNPSGESSDPNMLGDNQDLKIFHFEQLLIATNYFNESTKLGRGGFGSVYKGELLDGQVVAIKRLSKSSGQGSQEFKNEVVVISKLQHRNLVRLLGCCIAEEEKILIYEYMPNNSLDTYLFGSDPTKRELLDWRKRFQIIEGISRGILYLHRDSRLKVIHRDLKPSNVLLDEELNPKISDFGMARIFGSNELQANTNRVVGTYGYMSPEYAMEGQFSEKSDVFSFGVLLLEIVSGRRNTSFYNHDQSLSLLKYAWLLWNENKIESLIEPMLSEQPHCKLEIVRCIHVGLLCVQEFANDRPTMSTTLSMLTSEIATLPTPKQPAFTQKLPSSHSSSHEHKTFSVNTITLTSVGGR